MLFMTAPVNLSYECAGDVGQLPLVSTALGVINEPAVG